MLKFHAIFTMKVLLPIHVTNISCRTCLDCISIDVFSYRYINEK